MKSKLYILLALLLFLQTSFAQLQTSLPGVAASTGFSGTGSNMNVVYHRVNWTIDPRGTKTITGSIVTYFKTTSASVNSISFDLNSGSFNNASLIVTYHGTTCTRTCASNILTITLPVTIAAANTLDSITVNYSGIPPGVSGAAEGYQAGGTGNEKYTMSLSESYEDRDWWPCKADMQDKIDSMDINVTVPWILNAVGDTFWVATNGVLYDSTISGSTRTFKFLTRYPIASYLVAVSVAKFTRYYTSVNVNGTTTQVAYYLLRNTTNHATKITAMNKINAVLQALSTKFGDYPFKNEKHGFYDGLLGAGGMEHQTFSGIANGSLTSLTTLAHELVHQWFGDNVSFSTWNDLWLAEGFANYGEVLSAELVAGIGNAYTIRSNTKTNALALNAASVWLPNSYAADSHGIWENDYGSTVYERGGMVVSMLRAIAGDTKFFQALTNYQTARAGKSATTDTLRDYFNAVLGQDISEFFKDYVGGSGAAATAVGGIGNPTVSINWASPVAKSLQLQIAGQTRSAGSNVTYFNGPVVVHVTNAATSWTKDTTIVFYDWGSNSISKAGNGLSPNTGTNLLTYTLSFTPTNVFIDDSSRTMVQQGTITKLSTLAVNITDFTAQKTSGGNESFLSLTTTDPITKIELQKSTNGTDFTTLGNMNLSSIVNQTNNYKFTDIAPFTGSIYYRAKIYYAGKEEYSDVVKIQSARNKQMAITPNPASKEVKITFDNVSRKEVKVILLNADGKKVAEKTTKADYIQFDVNNLADGIYMAQIIQQDEIAETSKFLVRH